MQTLGPAIVAFALATLVTAVELLTTRYQHTAFLLLRPGRCWSLYSYAVSYGAIAALLTAILHALTASHVLRIEGLGLANPWIRALYVGLFTKSLMQFSLLSVGEERIGFATLLGLFEPKLIRSIDLDEDHWVKVYIAPHVNRYTDSEDVRRRIIADIPMRLPDPERKAFELDISKAETVGEAMRLTLRQLGRRAFDRIFPL